MEIKPNPLLGSKVTAIDEIIQEKIKNFIYRIVVYSKQKKIALDPRRKPLDAGFMPLTSNKNQLDAIEALSMDDKFISMLKVIREGFNEGCNVLFRDDV